MFCRSKFRRSISGTALLLVPVFFFFSACQSRPIVEMALADTALKSAQKAKADALAVDLFRKAENNFLRAKRDYKDGYFDSAKKFATEARKYAERAEFKALQKQSALRAGGTGGGTAGGDQGLEDDAFNEGK